MSDVVSDLAALVDAPRDPLGLVADLRSERARLQARAAELGAVVTTAQRELSVCAQRTQRLDDLLRTYAAVDAGPPPASATGAAPIAPRRAAPSRAPYAPDGALSAAVQRDLLLRCDPRVTVRSALYFTPERVALVERGWVGYVPVQDLLAAVNALPGLEVNLGQLRNLACTQLKLRRPSDIRSRVYFAKGPPGEVIALPEEVVSPEEIVTPEEVAAVDESAERVPDRLATPLTSVDATEVVRIAQLDPVLSVARAAVLTERWPTTCTNYEILDELNALPGPFVHLRKMGRFAKRLGLGARPPPPPAPAPIPPPEAPAGSPLDQLTSSPEREARIAALWPGYRSSREILAEVNALPGAQISIHTLHKIAQRIAAPSRPTNLGAHLSAQQVVTDPPPAAPQPKSRLEALMMVSRALTTRDGYHSTAGRMAVEDSARSEEAVVTRGDVVEWAVSNRVNSVGADAEVLAAVNAKRVGFGLPPFVVRER